MMLNQILSPFLEYFIWLYSCLNLIESGSELYTIYCAHRISFNVNVMHYQRTSNINTLASHGTGYVNYY